MLRAQELANALLAPLPADAALFPAREHRVDAKVAAAVDGDRAHAQTRRDGHCLVLRAEDVSGKPERAVVGESHGFIEIPAQTDIVEAGEMVKVKLF